VNPSNNKEKSIEVELTLYYYTNK